MEPNKWMRPDRPRAFARLSDGTPLYPAYYHLLPGEAYRRRMGLWTGQAGEWVGVTLDGQLYRQERLWGGEEPCPKRWQRFTISGW